MELPWDNDQHGRDGSDDGWWLYKSIHVLIALAHQRTHVEKGRERSDTGHPEQWTVEHCMLIVVSANTVLSLSHPVKYKGVTTGSSEVSSHQENLMAKGTFNTRLFLYDSLRDRLLENLNFMPELENGISDVVI
uniref:Uncharacterized protein n=1 Tax=Oryza glumipatula TaxID=40148 RepID=A0A0D9YA61_9ORYZ